MDSEGYADEDDDLGGFADAASEKPNFREGDLKYAKMRIDSPYKAEAYAHIRKMGVTGRLKVEYYSCIHSLFSQETVLANNFPRAESRFIRSDPLKAILIYGKQSIKRVAACSATKGDKLNYDVGALENNIYRVFLAFATRTLGDNRESLRNNTITTESSTRTPENNGYNSYQPKKSGLLNLRG